MKLGVYLCRAGRLSERVFSRYSRKIRIDDILETYRREGANRRALEKERAKLEAMSEADIEVLHAATKRANPLKQRRDGL
jgi:hypothetical protein